MRRLLVVLIVWSDCAASLKLSTQLRVDELTVGRVVIPTLARADWESRAEFRRVRTEMFEKGLYPGVDYEIEAKEDDSVSVRPMYPLVKRLERSDWPVTVPMSLAPRWMDPAAYNLLTAAFALALAASGLLVGAAASLFFTFSYVPSASMQPAIQPGDLILVEKLTPRTPLPLKEGDLVFFEPPEALQAIVSQRQKASFANSATQDGAAIAVAPNRVPGFTPQQLFVKRIAAIGGDEVEVDRTGGVTVVRGETVRVRQSREVPPARLVDLLRPGRVVVEQGSYFVTGDNSDVSIDSRCWGVLPRDKLVGRPVLRVLPFQRFGPVN